MLRLVFVFLDLLKVSINLIEGFNKSRLKVSINLGTTTTNHDTNHVYVRVVVGVEVCCCVPRFIGTKIHGPWKYPLRVQHNTSKCTTESEKSPENSKTNTSNPYTPQTQVKKTTPSTKTRNEETKTSKPENRNRKSVSTVC